MVPVITAVNPLRMLRPVPRASGVRPPHHRRPLAEPVLLDWERLVAGCADLAAALDAIGFIPVTARGLHPSQFDPDADAALAEMVQRAATDRIAARVVLQRILPGLVAIARRRAGAAGDPHAALDELLANGWIVIRRFPVARRRRFVAMGLLRDIEY